jgi:hypothetical protein
LRSEGRTGGPVDPFTSFNETVELLFNKSGNEHSMYELIYRFSYSVTPRSLNSVKEEGDNPEDSDDAQNQQIKDEMRNAVV